MRNAQAEAILGDRIVEGLEIASTERWTLENGRRVEAQEHPLLRAMTLGESTGAEEFCYEGGDGSKVKVSVTAAPIRGGDGVVVGGVLTIRESQRELVGVR
jgi:hypothetical protein